MLADYVSFSAEISGSKNIVSLTPKEKDSGNLYYKIVGDEVGETTIKMKSSTNRTTWFNVVVVDSEDDLPDFTPGELD